MNTHQTEKGQALVLIALALVAIFGFTALAVDMGRVFSEQRRMQSAADTGAMAAAFKASNAASNGKSINETALSAAVLQKLQDNDVVPETGRTQVVYHHPPASGPYQGNAQYYQVIITTQVDQVFSGFVFSGAQQLTVEAVARAQPAQSIYSGNALVATNEHECSAIDFNGGVDTTVSGGSIFSNSEGNAKGGSCTALTQGGSGKIIVKGGQVLTVGNYKGSTNPAPTTGAAHLAPFDLATPDCSKAPNRGSVSAKGTITIEPGTYSSIDVKDTVIMKPGLYCLNGEFSVGAQGKLSGTGVLIVMLQGGVKFNGGGGVNLSKPIDLVDGAGEHWGGMLLFMPNSNGEGIDIGGNSTMNISGTIYAPGPRSNLSKAKCKIGGTSGNIGVNANVICNTISISGNAVVNITYKENENYRQRPMMELAQ